MKHFLTLLLFGSLAATTFAQTTTEVVSGMLQAYGLAVRGNEMYVSDRNGNRVYKFDLSSANPSLEEVVTITNPTGLDFAGDYMYVTTSNGSTTGTGIYRVDLSAPTPSPENIYETSAITYGTLINNSTLYFTDATSNQVISLDISGESFPADTLVTGLAFPQGLALQDNTLYIAETQAGAITSIPLNDPMPVTSTVANGLGSIFTVARNGSFLYLSTVAGLTRVDLNTSNPTGQMVPGVSFSSFPFGTAFYQGALYVCSAGSVFKVDGLAPSFTLPDQVCYQTGEPIQGGATPTGGVYSGPGVTDGGDGESFMFDFAGQGAGSYTVTYTLGMASDTAQLNVVEGVTAMLNVGLDTTFFSLEEAGCYPLTASATGGSGNYTYSWSGGFGSQTLTLCPFATGSFGLTVTDPSTGCQDELTHNYTFLELLAGERCGNAIDINSLFGGPANEPQTSSIYDNTSYNAEGDPDFGFECFFEVTSPEVIDPPFNNTIFFSFIGDGNSYRIAAPNCNAANPISGNDTQIALYAGSCAALTAVSCNDDSSPNNLVAAVEFTAVAGQAYTILVDGFSGIDSGFPENSPLGEFCLEVTNLGPSSVTNIQNSNIQISPNPTDGLLRLDEIEAKRVSVYDIAGRQVADFSRPGNQIDISQLPQGVYSLRMEDREGRLFSARVVKR